MAQIYFDLNDTLNALAYFEKALQRIRDHPVSLIGRARAAIARGEKIKVATDDLASLLGRARPNSPRRSSLMALTARSELKMYNRQCPDAIKDARDATAADRSYAPAHEALGWRSPMTRRGGGPQASFDRPSSSIPTWQASTTRRPRRW